MVGWRRLTGSLGVVALAVAAAHPAAAQAPPAPEAAAAQLERQACPSEHVPPPRFRDVSTGDVHGHAIACILLWEVTQGRTSGRYDPLGTVTRAQMASFVFRTLVTAGERFDPDPPTAFDDVTGVHATAIDTLAAVGVVRGVAPGRFDPDRPVTRAESATLLHRAAERLHGQDLPPQRDPWFEDVSGTHEAAIRSLAERTVVLGVSERRFAPDRAIGRAQMASMIARFLGRLRQHEQTQPPWQLRFHPTEQLPPDDAGSPDGSVAVADLTGDGRDDLVYHEGTRSPADREQWLHVFHAGQHGLELVQSELTRATGAYPSVESVAVGRFTDGPGPDVAHPFEGGIEIWRNDGSGRFSSELVLEGARTWLIVAGDVTGNGLDDIVGRERANGEALRIVPQTAPGVFGPVQEIDVPAYGHSATVDLGDVDGDGRLDLVLVSHLHAVTLHQRAPGVFEPHEHAWRDDELGYGGTVGDVTGDGADDLVLNRSGLYVHRIAERGVAADPDEYRPGGTRGRGAIVGDLTGDGRSEVVTGSDHRGYLRVYLVDEDGTVAGHQNVGGFRYTGHRGIAMLDATGNGKRDLVASTQSGLRLAPRY